MSQIMYRALNGVNETEKGKPGDHLTIGTSGVPVWRRFDAKSIPFLTTAIDAPANLGETIDAVIAMTKTIAAEVASLKTKTTTAIVERGAETDALIGGLRSLRTAVNELTEQDTAHQQLRLSNSSNPALRLEYNEQILRLDLSQPGSFDDALARLGVDNLQDAIVRVVLLCRSVDRKSDVTATAIREAEQRINDLQSSVVSLSQQVRQLSERLSQQTSQ